MDEKTEAEEGQFDKSYSTNIGKVEFGSEVSLKRVQTFKYIKQTKFMVKLQQKDVFES